MTINWRFVRKLFIQPLDVWPSTKCLDNSFKIWVRRNFAEEFVHVSPSGGKKSAAEGKGSEAFATLHLKTFQQSTQGWFTFSVTRFGEISPLGRNYKSLWWFLRLNFVFEKFFNLLWQKIWNWAKIQYCKWPNIEAVTLPSGHTVHLDSFKPANIFRIASESYYGQIPN